MTVQKGNLDVLRSPFKYASVRPGIEPACLLNASPCDSQCNAPKATPHNRTWCSLYTILPIHIRKSLLPGGINLFVLIQLLPTLLYPLALLLRRLAIQSRPLKALRSQAHIDFIFGVGAVPRDFPDESACMAFFEGSDDVCAILLDLFGMQMGMHCDRGIGEEWLLGLLGQQRVREGAAFGWRES